MDVLGAQPGIGAAEGAISIDALLRSQDAEEEKQIPQDIDYEDVLNLSLEAKQKLSEIRPVTIAQASRISGINPADISVLLIYLKQHY